MNASNAKDYLPLVQALAEGKVIQCKYQYSDGSCEWVDLKGRVSFDADPDRYRIKPEPKEIWLNEYPDGIVYVHTSKASADESVFGRGVVKHYREVIE